jgi:putative copper export protein
LFIARCGAIGFANIRASAHPNKEARVMKPRWTDWLVAAALALSLSALGAALTTLPDDPRQIALTR